MRFHIPTLLAVVTLTLLLSTAGSGIDTEKADAGAVPVLLGDVDCDGFSTTEEGTIGTDPNDPCANTPGPNDEADDRWPADFNDDQVCDIEDFNQLTPPYFNTFPPNPLYSTRKDFNGDGVIDIEEINRVTPPTFNQSCTP